MSVFHSLGRRNRLFVRAAGGTSFGARPWFEAFSLGGPFRMSAFDNDELTGANFAFAGVGYLRQLPRLPAWVGGHAYLATWVEAGSAFDARADSAWHGDVSAGVIVDSIIGPVVRRRQRRPVGTSPSLRFARPAVQVRAGAGLTGPGDRDRFGSASIPRQVTPGARSGQPAAWATRKGT